MSAIRCAECSEPIAVFHAGNTAAQPAIMLTSHWHYDAALGAYRRGERRRRRMMVYRSAPPPRASRDERSWWWEQSSDGRTYLMVKPPASLECPVPSCRAVREYGPQT